jgi:hypothetical protein
MNGLATCCAAQSRGEARKAAAEWCTEVNGLGWWSLKFATLRDESKSVGVIRGRAGQDPLKK